MQACGIAFVAVKTIVRILIVQVAHFSITRDFGNNRSRTDGLHCGITFNNGLSGAR